MININFKNNFELYTDYENCLNFLKNNNFSYKDKNIIKGSKFYLLQNYIHKLLIERDLY